MTLSTLKKMRTGCSTSAMLLWVGFVYYISSDLYLSSILVNMFLGFASLWDWYAVLEYLAIHRKSEDGYEYESTNAPSERTRTAMRRLIYIMTLGAVAWAVIVYKIPPPRSVGFQWLVSADPVLRGVHGLLSPHVWLAAAYLIIDNDSFWRNVMGTQFSGHQRESSPKTVRNTLGWALIVFAAMNWVIFVLPLTLKMFGLWDLVFCFAALLAPWFSLAALYLSIKYEQESKTGCCSETRSN